MEDNLGYTPTLGSGGFEGGTLPPLEEESKLVHSTLGEAFEGGIPSTLEESSTPPLGLLGGVHQLGEALQEEGALFYYGSSRNWSKSLAIFTIILEDNYFYFIFALFILVVEAFLY